MTSSSDNRRSTVPIETSAVRLDRHLRDAAAEWYAGVVDRETGVLVRLVRPPDRTVYERLLRLIEVHLGSTQTAQIGTATWTIQELEVAAERVVAAVAKHPHLEPSRWGVDVEANRVLVGYLGHPALMEALLEELGYDDAIVRAEQDPELSGLF